MNRHDPDLPPVNQHAPELSMQASGVELMVVARGSQRGVRASELRVSAVPMPVDLNAKQKVPVPRSGISGALPAGSPARSSVGSSAGVSRPRGDLGILQIAAAMGNADADAVADVVAVADVTPDPTGNQPE